MIVFIVWIKWNEISFSAIGSTLFSEKKNAAFFNLVPCYVLFWRCTKQNTIDFLCSTLFWHVYQAIPNTTYMLIAEVCHVDIWNWDSIPISFRQSDSPWLTIKLNLLYLYASAPQAYSFRN